MISDVVKHSCRKTQEKQKSCERDPGDAATACTGGGASRACGGGGGGGIGRGKIDGAEAVEIAISHGMYGGIESLGLAAHLPHVLHLALIGWKNHFCKYCHQSILVLRDEMGGREAYSGGHQGCLLGGHIVGLAGHGSIRLPQGKESLGTNHASTTGIYAPRYPSR